MANLNLNKVILGGRLTADPELKTTQSGLSVTTFTLAVSRKTAKDGAQPQTDFINVTAWRQTAEFITRYFRRASSICIVGSIQTRSYEKDGQKRHITEVVADEAYFVDSKSENTQSAAPPSQTQTTPSTYIPEAYQSTLEEISDEEEIPF